MVGGPLVPAVAWSLLPSMSEPPPDLKYSRQVVANDGVAGGVSGQRAGWRDRRTEAAGG